MGEIVRPILPVVALALILTGCAAHQSATSSNSTAPAISSTLSGDPAHPGRTGGWVETKLYFGLGLADHPEQGVSEEHWHEFLDREVSPRFPDGLSVLDVYGQWQGKDQTAPERLRSKCLIIDYPDTQPNRDKIEAIRAAWKKMTGDQSVMRVTQPADVSF